MSETKSATTETAETVDATKVVEKAAAATETVITELVESIPMTMLLAAIVIGVIIGAGVVLLMDESKREVINVTTEEVAEVPAA